MPSWSGVASETSAMTSCCWPGESAAGSPSPALLRQRLEAARSIALDPAVHRVGMHPKHPRGLGLAHAIQHRLDGTFMQRRLGGAWQGSSVLIRHALESTASSHYLLTVVIIGPDALTAQSYLNSPLHP